MFLTKIIRRASLLAMPLAYLLVVGCDRKEVAAPVLPQVPASRVEAPEFREKMRQDAAGQNQVAARLAAIEEKMAAIRARTKAPEADPEWKQLVAAREACAAEMKEKLKGTRADARAALLQQAADKAAVAAGHAVYATESNKGK
ncbi:MAG: hypothetical protein MJ240_04605 [Kiritimatiellae bacterium]|nr:hypothetical protein [Kiritimatiellia bacterium]